jgi:hypothetical protein
VDGLDPGPEPFEAAADVHQARIVPGGADLGLRVEDVPDLVPEHGHRGVRILDRERPAEAAALLGFRQLHEVYAPHGPQQLKRGVAYP